MGASDIGTSCDPVLRISDLGDKTTKVSLCGTTLRSDDVAYPCGLIAKYFFNDTYALVDEVGGVPIPIDEKNIAHSVDRDYKFKLPEGVDNPTQRAWLNITNEHVMVWY